MFTIRRSLLSTPLTSSIRRTFTTSPTPNSFAKLTLVGRLTAQPELHATSTGREILRYGVATDSGRGDNKKTSFFNVTSFAPEGGARDFRLGLDKGTMVYIEGEATISYYQDAEQKQRTSLNVVEQKLEVLQYMKRDEGAAPGGQ